MTSFAGHPLAMRTEIYIEALLVNEELADQVWEAWNAGEIGTRVACLARLLPRIRDMMFLRSSEISTLINQITSEAYTYCGSIILARDPIPNLLTPCINNHRTTHFVTRLLPYLVNFPRKNERILTHILFFLC